MRVSAIIPAAGYGTRMGGVKKPFVTLGGKPILAHTLAVFQVCPLVNEISVVVSEGDEQRCDQLVSRYGIDKVARIVPGGETRQESVFNALQRVSPDTGMVIIHDGVRPFVTEEMISETLQSASQFGAAISAVPVKDTVKEADDDGFVIRTLKRQGLWLIQTPQTFKYDLILRSHLYARENCIQTTDDASLVERIGACRVKLVMGTYENIKITTPGDLVIAEAILRAKRS